MKTDDGRELGARRFQHWLDTGEDELPEEQIAGAEGVQLNLLADTSGATLSPPKRSPGDAQTPRGMTPPTRPEMHDAA